VEAAGAGSALEGASRRSVEFEITAAQGAGGGSGGGGASGGAGAPRTGDAFDPALWALLLAAAAAALAAIAARRRKKES
jgi:hypothetical protein